MADEEKQAGIHGQWQQDSPAKEYLDQVKCCDDTDCNEPMMKKSLEKMKASERAFDRIKKTFELAAQDGAEKMSIVHEIMLRSTDYLRRIITPIRRTRRSHDVLLVPALQQFPLGRLRLVGLWGRNPQSGGTQIVERNTIGSNRTGFWSYKQGTVLSRPMSSRRMRYLKACAQI